MKPADTGGAETPGRRPPSPWPFVGLLVVVAFLAVPQLRQLGTGALGLAAIAGLFLKAAEGRYSREHRNG